MNRQFAERTLLRAADIVCNDQPFGQPDAVDALLRAKAELLAAEPAEQTALRTYGGAEIIPDFGRYIINRYPEFRHPAGFAPTIGPWCRSRNAHTVADVLRDASTAIGATVAERTVIAEQLECLNDIESDQLLTLDRFSGFLTRQGVAATIRWNKPCEGSPIEFDGLINDTRWSFDVTHLTVPNPRFPTRDETPANEVQHSLDFAADRATKSACLAQSTGDRRCLIVHNWAYTHPTQWADVNLPTAQFDAVVIMHNDDVTATRIWQIHPPDAFGARIPTRTINDLNQAVQRRLDQNPKVNPEHIRQAWAAAATSGLTEADILRITEED